MHAAARERSACALDDYEYIQSIFLDVRENAEIAHFFWDEKGVRL
jgi:hypothetical protein